MHHNCPLMFRNPAIKKAQSWQVLYEQVIRYEFDSQCPIGDLGDCSDIVASPRAPHRKIQFRNKHERPYTLRVPMWHWDLRELLQKLKFYMTASWRSLQLWSRIKISLKISSKHIDLCTRQYQLQTYPKESLQLKTLLERVPKRCRNHLTECFRECAS